MIVLEDLDASCSAARPCALTLGSFDGVHKGHQLLLKKLRDLVGPEGSVVVVTFSNHPSHILPGRVPHGMILSKKLKLEALEDCGVDVVYIVPFTMEIAGKTYEEFCRGLWDACPFDYLVLGEDARLGKGREGTREKVTELGEEVGFKAVYISKAADDVEMISSRRIRKCILEGDLDQAKQLMGRPARFEIVIEDGIGHFADGICIPKDGMYNAIIDGQAEKIHIRNQVIEIGEAFPKKGLFLLTVS